MGKSYCPILHYRGTETKGEVAVGERGLEKIYLQDISRILRKGEALSSRAVREKET